MAYICNKPSGSCGGCLNYRFDDDYGVSACFAAIAEANVQVGDTIRIVYMDGEEQYNGKEGIVKSFDNAGQLHGTWGGLAVLPNKDQFDVIEKAEQGIDR